MCRTAPVKHQVDVAADEGNDANLATTLYRSDGHCPMYAEDLTSSAPAA